MLSASLNITFPFILVSPIFFIFIVQKNMQQSVVSVRYELGTFWLGPFRFGYVLVGYVLCLYILTETIYKLKVHDF